jgi:hypothetical protein
VLFNIRSWADVRAGLYTLLPILSVLLVSHGVVTDNQAQLWTALVTAVLGPLIAAINAKSVSAIRTAIYALAGSAQALAIGYNLVEASTFAQWLPLFTALVGITAAVPAVANTDTTPADAAPVVTVHDADGARG